MIEHTATSETYQTTRCHHYPQNSMEQIPCSELTQISLKKNFMKAPGSLPC